jgi:hypothetical protein
MINRKFLAVVVLAVVSSAPMAMADTTLISFAYDRFVGTYSSTTAATGSFSINPDTSGATINDRSAGSGSRLIPTTGTVNFDWGLATIGAANVETNVAVTGLNAATAGASGTLILTDIDGDTITALLTGTWYNTGGSASLVATLSSVVFSGGNGLWNGNNGGTPWSIPAFALQLTGTLLELSSDHWFTDAAVGTSINSTVGMTGSIKGVVPAPGASLLIAVGLGLVGWAKRRLA